MNIFTLDESPRKSAEMMLDKHVVKMPTESLQMLFTIVDHLGLEAGWKPVMLNHPSTIWARETRQNFQWLREHTYALCNEYTFRYGRIHKVEVLMNQYAEQMDEAEMLLPDDGLTPFAIAISPHMECRKSDGFDEMSTIEKYRQYYLDDKWRFAIWTKRAEPSWWPKDHYLNKSFEYKQEADALLMRLGLI